MVSSKNPLLGATVDNLRGTVTALEKQMKMILEQGSSGYGQDMAVTSVTSDGGYYVM